MKTKILSGFTDVTLDDDSQFAEGRKDFFAHVMQSLQKLDDGDDMSIGMASFIIGREIEGTGGYFTDRAYLSRIVLPEGTATYDPDRKTIRFKDDEAFTVFIHEASHLLHVSVDRGVYMSPAFKDRPALSGFAGGKVDPNETKYAEYEAGYRSLYYNQIYEMFPDNSAILKLNVANMTHYMEPRDKDELRRRYKELTTDEERKKFKEELTERMNAWEAGVTKWSQLADFKMG